MPYPKLARLVLPLTRKEWPGHYRAMKFVAGRGRADDAYWVNAGARIIKGKWHGYRMRLDLSNWADRTAYFLGRYYEREIQTLLRTILRPGDRFVDGGANVGMLTLLAAKQVGAIGRVDAIEPNPTCIEHLTRHVRRLNELPHVHLYRQALSDEDGKVTLNTVPNADGFGTLAKLEDGQASVYTETHQIDAVRGDFLLLTTETPVTLMKLDLEGYECHALRGMVGTLRRDHPMLITEINPYCLNRAGSSVNELYELLSDKGYNAYRIESRETRWRYRLRLIEVHHPSELTSTDALWIANDDPRIKRVKRLIRKRDYSNCLTPSISSAA